MAFDLSLYNSSDWKCWSVLTSGSPAHGPAVPRRLNTRRPRTEEQKVFPSSNGFWKTQSGTRATVLVCGVGVGCVHVCIFFSVSEEVWAVSRKSVTNNEQELGNSSSLRGEV